MRKTKQPKQAQPNPTEYLELYLNMLKETDFVGQRVRYAIEVKGKTPAEFLNNDSDFFLEWTGCNIATEAFFEEEKITTNDAEQIGQRIVNFFVAEAAFVPVLFDYSLKQGFSEFLADFEGVKNTDAVLDIYQEYKKNFIHLLKEGIKQL